MKRTHLLIFLSVISLNAVVSQSKSKEEILSEFDELSKLETSEILKEGFNFKSYLYKGTNLDRNPVQDFSNYPQKVLFYWSTDCRYCKKELSELERIIDEQPYLKDSILVIMRVAKQNREWSLQKEGDSYILYKNKKDFMRLSVPLLFLSEKILEESFLIGAPYTFFLNDMQEIEYIKPAYFASKRGSQVEEINYEFLKWKITNYLDSQGPG